MGKANKRTTGSAKKSCQTIIKKQAVSKSGLAKTLLRKKAKTSSKNKFICDICKARFPTWWQRRTHWLASGHKVPEQCRWCRQKTYTLQSHLCKKHWECATMCPNCGQLFMFQEDFDKHALQHDKSEYRCSHCGRLRKSEELLRTHVHSHFLHEKYGCNICEKRFKKKINLEKHLISVHFICKYCGDTSGSAGELMKHLVIHDDLKCVYCHKVFSQKNRLKYHYQVLHGHQDLYKCPTCSQKFAKKSLLMNHVALRHRGVSNFKCKICSEPFLYWQQYQNHFKTRHLKINEDIFDCSFCKFSTNLKTKLKWHVEKSSGTGFFCKKCQIPLECKGKFDQHMEKHEGERVWTCDHCPGVYQSDNILRKHIVEYHQLQALTESPRMYHCLEAGCTHFYVSKSSLARHVRKKHSASLRTRNTPSNSLSVSSLDEESADEKSGSEKKREESNDGQKVESVKSQSNKINTHESENCEISDEETNDNVSDLDKEQKQHCNDQKEESTKSHCKVKDMQISKDRILTEGNSSSDQGSCADETPSNNIIEVDVYHCAICQKMWFSDEPQFKRHMRTHSKKVWQEKCDSCDIVLETPKEAVKHYAEVHLKVQFVSD